MTEQQKTAEPCGDEPHPCACKFKDDECIDPCAYHVDLEAGYKQLEKINDELGIKLAKWHNEKIGFTAAPTQIDAGELEEVIAAVLWQIDYPNGGSMYKTYESTQFHDKELYRKDARAHLSKLSLPGTVPEEHRTSQHETTCSPGSHEPGRVSKLSGGE